jgi:hypothetical protein
MTPLNCFDDRTNTAVASELVLFQLWPDPDSQFVILG